MWLATAGLYLLLGAVVLSVKLVAASVAGIRRPHRTVVLWGALATAVPVALCVPLLPDAGKAESALFLVGLAAVAVVEWAFLVTASDGSLGSRRRMLALTALGDVIAVLLAVLVYIGFLFVISPLFYPY